MKVDTYLKQNGFRFIREKGHDSISEAQGLYSYHKRIKYKKDNPEVYPKLFELILKDLMINKFGFEAENGVKITDEGSGGDYDVLAVNHLNEMVYIECKTGKNIKKRDMEEFYKRHLFLKPSLSIVVFDQAKKDVEKYLALMRSVLTDDSKRRDKTIAKMKEYQYPNYDIIPEPEREFAYHMDRNLFFCSGEDIERAVAHCLRYFNGVVKQSSYWC
jgi:hypothetical protein